MRIARSTPLQRLQPSCSTTPRSISTPRALALENVRVRRALNSLEYRGAAYLRAHSFSVFPDAQAGDFARAAFLRMRADEKWEEIEAAVQLTSPIVLPLIVSATADEGLGVPALCIPHDAPAPPEWILGTLDVNIGPKLPSEELIGSLPPSFGAAATKRAYLSNVCTLQEVRRRGLAQRLVTGAAELAAERGVEHLYVHVIHDNHAARQLYTERCGFEIEGEEKEATARALNRPRRLLLHRRLT
jgi:ribosomal protein S18 acetylase RimI-like enzyme